MKINQLFKWIAASLTALMLVLGLGVTALAYESIDNSREASLTVQFEKDGTGFAETQFRLYRVAEMSDMVRFTLTGDFSAYPVSLEDLDSSGWRALAQTLDAYVSRDSLTPFQTAVTDSAGRAIFEHLPIGLYLVTGSRYMEGRYTYIPEAFMVCLPGLGEETDEWIYDVSASCKYNSDYDPPEGGGDNEDLSRKVLKVWNDNGNTSRRPASITVQLLKDGQVYDTVILNDENNWRYTWSDLDDDSEWKVTEYDTPAGYTVSIDRQGITFVMTNTRRGSGGDDDDDGGGGNDDSGGGGSENGGGGDGSSELLETILDNITPLGVLPEKWGELVLPQTGMLWWPIPVLTAVGALLCLAGWRKQRHGKQ